jgi:hypothetical protein
MRGCWWLAYELSLEEMNRILEALLFAKASNLTNFSADE